MHVRSPDPARCAPADVLACRRLLRGGSRSFYAASLFLPRRVREPACVLYAFCRLADDAVDLRDGKLDAVERLRTRLLRVYEGRALELPVDRALAGVVRRFDIPPALLMALLEGLEWDARARRYDSIEELYAYGARVAGAVGAMMALIMGARSCDALARACDLGVAMQLSNIARDVGEDARAGRIYLPRAWLEEAGIVPERWLAAPRFDPALAAVVARVLSAADGLYRRASAGIGLLPVSCRPGIQAARWLYDGIGREVLRQGCDSVSRRAVVPPVRKAYLLAQALMSLRQRRATATASEPPLDATRFLVDAVASASRPVVAARGSQDAAGSRSVEQRVVWLLDLFERLERREIAARSG